jgi:hypothetical protein
MNQGPLEKLVLNLARNSQPFMEPEVSLAWYISFSRRWMWKNFLLVGCAVKSGNRPDDGGSKDLWNVGQFLRDYMAQRPRRRPSSQDLIFCISFGVLYVKRKSAEDKPS